MWVRAYVCMRMYKYQEKEYEHIYGATPRLRAWVRLHLCRDTIHPVDTDFECIRFRHLTGDDKCNMEYP